MASTSMSSVLFLLVATFAASASAATFTVKNNCSSTVWPAAIPVGGGTQLEPGQTWTVDVLPGTTGRFWGRTGCSFVGGSGHCNTGDCAGALNCTVSGQPPTTLAEFSIGGTEDFYDISVIDGYNLPMAFSCSTGAGLVCTSPTCPEAYRFPDDDSKTPGCSGNSNYQLTFCP
ncbi:thaumatin-like pathogenesis-related protein 4 [Miscanthus floridulus]|uniref:thaumatin-like pathogenesis-related protein 4 n=1 Tax=Miscanthus floridulus TaxID=154761 RepID=UPI00345B352E